MAYKGFLSQGNLPGAGKLTQGELGASAARSGDYPCEYTLFRVSYQLYVKNTNSGLLSLLLSEAIIWLLITALHAPVYSPSLDNLHIELLRQLFKHL